MVVRAAVRPRRHMLLACRICWEFLADRCTFYYVLDSSASSAFECALPGLSASLLGSVSLSPCK